MPDRDKVIGLLQETAEYFRGCRNNASFASKAENHFWELQNAANEAVELLKEQEPVKQKVSEWLEDSDPGQEYGTTWACRKCMHSIHRPYIWNPYDSGYKYCPHCGAMMEVTWDA